MKVWGGRRGLREFFSRPRPLRTLPLPSPVEQRLRPATGQRQHEADDREEQETHIVERDAAGDGDRQCPCEPLEQREPRGGRVDHLVSYGSGPANTSVERAARRDAPRRSEIAWGSGSAGARDLGAVGSATGPLVSARVCGDAGCNRRVTAEIPIAAPVPRLTTARAVARFIAGLSRLDRNSGVLRVAGPASFHRVRCARRSRIACRSSRNCSR